MNTFIAVLGSLFFVITSWYIDEDRNKMERAIKSIPPPGAAESNGETVADPWDSSFASRLDNESVSVDDKNWSSRYKKQLFPHGEFFLQRTYQSIQSINQYIDSINQSIKFCFFICSHGSLRLMKERFFLFCGLLFCGVLSVSCNTVAVWTGALGALCILCTAVLHTPRQEWRSSDIRAV